MKHLTVVDAATLAAALPFDRLVAALRGAFADPAIEVPPRHVHAWEDAAGQPVQTLLMPAWRAPNGSGDGDGDGDGSADGGHYGVKIVNVAPANAARGLPALHGSYLLHEAASGRPLALLDGGELTARRTAAVAALAASHLAHPEAARLLIVGAGRVAALLPAALAAVRPIHAVRVWARRPEAAEALAARWREAGFAAEPVAPDALAEAVGWAQIVSCATFAAAPLVQGAWLAPGSHLDLIGSFTPAMREADDAALVGARVFVDDTDALAKSGDLAGPIAAGAFAAGQLRGTLADLCRGAVPGRTQGAQRTVFKSVGTARADLAAAVAALAALPALSSSVAPSVGPSAEPSERPPAGPDDTAAG